MSGWEKVAAATLLAVVALIGVNLAIWRRLRVATLDRGAGARDPNVAEPLVQQSEDEEQQTVHLL